MGCDKLGHRHKWPTSGTLIIQRCENRCNFCEGEAAKKTWKFAWFLRRHVRSVHIKNGKGNFPSLIIPMDWDEGKLRGNPNLEKAIKQEDDVPIIYIDQPYFEEQQINEEYFATGRVPQYINQPDLSLAGRTLDPSNAPNSGGPSYTFNKNGKWLAFSDEVPAVASRYFSLDAIESFLFGLTVDGFEKMMADAAAASAGESNAAEVSSLRGEHMSELEFGRDEDEADVEQSVGEYAESPGYGNYDDDGGDDDMTYDDEAEAIAEAAGASWYNEEDSIFVGAEESEGAATPKNFNEVETPTTAAGHRFFMSDYEHGDNPDEDISTQTPWAGVLRPGTMQPHFHECRRMFGLLCTAADHMQSQGMSVSSMLPCLDVFTRNLSGQAEQEQSMENIHEDVAEQRLHDNRAN